MEYSYVVEDVEVDDVLELLEELNSSEYSRIISMESFGIMDNQYTVVIEVEITTEFINELEEDVLKKYAEMYSEEEYFMKERIKHYILSLIENPDPLPPASVDKYIHLLNKENYDFCECLEIELEKTKGLIHFTDYEEYVGAVQYINSISSKKYDVNVRYNAFTSTKENVVPEIEFNGTKLKHEIEEQNGTIYKFCLASIEAVE